MVKKKRQLTTQWNREWEWNKKSDLVFWWRQKKGGEDVGRADEKKSEGGGGGGGGCRLDRSRGGNELEDTASLICFHLLLINWVKLAKREKSRKGGWRKQWGERRCRKNYQFMRLRQSLRPPWKKSRSSEEHFFSFLYFLIRILKWAVSDMCQGVCTHACTRAHTHV